MGASKSPSSLYESFAERIEFLDEARFAVVCRHGSLVCICNSRVCQQVRLVTTQRTHRNIVELAVRFQFCEDPFLGTASLVVRRCPFGSDRLIRHNHFELVAIRGFLAAGVLAWC